MASKAVFFDTDLIITKIWLLHVYGKSPKWMDEALDKYPADLHLLCNYDLPWEPDSVRENPDIRPLLFTKYENEIISLNQSYVIISGVGEERLSNAITAIKNTYCILICLSIVVLSVNDRFNGQTQTKYSK